MPITLSINPHGRLYVEESGGDAPGPPDGLYARRIRAAFDEVAARGLLHLATAELQSPLAPDFAFARDFARDYLTRLCHSRGWRTARPRRRSRRPTPPRWPRRRCGRRRCGGWNT